jgi:hydrogenase maturation protease
MTEPADVLVLGLGNLLHADDGVGVHAIRSLEQDSRIPDRVVLLDGGTQGLNLISNIAGFRRLYVIDAVDVAEPPGSILRFEGKNLQGLPGKASVHQLGFADLLIALNLLEILPDEIVIFGVQPHSTEWSAELTPSVRAALPSLLEQILSELRS